MDSSGRVSFPYNFLREAHSSGASGCASFLCLDKMIHRMGWIVPELCLNDAILEIFGRIWVILRHIV